MKAVQVKEGIYWVGALDWHIRNFHGYTTNRGATYNAYLIIDEKITLIDTVKAPFAAEMLERISDVVDPSKIDYIVPCGDGPFRRSSGAFKGMPERDGCHQRA